MDVSPSGLSGSEEKLDRLRQRAGFIVAPLFFLALYFLPIAGLGGGAHRLLAILGLVVTLWITEAIPLAVTALLGPALCVVAGMGTAKDIFRNFGDPIIFLFLGSFLLAEAMFHHGLNRRIAFQVLGLKWVGESSTRVLLAFGVITAFLSMWISNTTTTAMMFPIGVSILSEMARRQTERTGQAVLFTQLRYGTGLMLIAAFAASLGGIGTPVGTPPNLIGLGMLHKYLQINLTFFQWMAFAVPLVVVLVAFLVFYLDHFCPAEPGLLCGSAQWIQAEKAKLGRLSRGERNVLLAFGVTIALWLLPGIATLAGGPEAPLAKWLNQRLPEGVSALLGASLLFVLPVDAQRRQFTLSWTEAKRVDWGTILLFGGGLALGDLMFSTGLGEWVGKSLAGAVHAKTALSLTFLFTGIAILFTETTSNTATATMIVPVAIAVAQAAGVNPLQPALGACLGASMAFMLPVSTPPNAIVYGSRCVGLMQMVKYGLVLDLVGFLIIVAVVTWLVPWIL